MDGPDDPRLPTKQHGHDVKAAVAERLKRGERVPSFGQPRFGQAAGMSISQTGPQRTSADHARSASSLEMAIGVTPSFLNVACIDCRCLR
jgi:hypothetical protein